MNKVILFVFLVLCIVALSYSSPLEPTSVGVAQAKSGSALSLTQEESIIPLGEEDHDADQQREKRQFFGGYGGYGRRRFGGYGGYGYGRRFGGYGGYGRGYGGYGFYG